MTSPTYVLVDGEILDLGDGKRLFSTPQRIAIALRDTTCTARGCDWPAYLCHFHHDTWVSKGGKTDLQDPTSH
ncbi:hypothetical protein GCM10009576_099880 [Streptomyces rhizosphaericus]|uniref:Uncharacterized protein n=2 Tax=Streptomyces rhizosphaericus TaxID=114699 RepID=A0ABP4E0L3_9ACTN